MPELPEVEATVRYLRERVTGATIARAEVLWHRTVATHTPKTFQSLIAGATILDVTRRGKFVVMHVHAHKPLFLCIHLRMSGSLDVVSKTSPPSAHDRIVLQLTNGKTIRFNDTRKFGRFYLCEDISKVLGTLGVEPLDEGFTPSELFNLTQQRATRIKALLLNQTIIAGLGNIYVDEALWKASIHPTTAAHRVSLPQCTALHAAIVETLSEAISLSGTDFGDGVVEGGMYSPCVYGREDEPCKRCSAMIKKIIVAQRGTHFCPRCQVTPRKRGSSRARKGSVAGHRRGLKPITRSAMRKAGAMR